MIIIIILTAYKIGTKMVSETNHNKLITIIVVFLLKTLLNAIGLLIAKYLSMLIAVIVKTDAATATPEKKKFNFIVVV